MIVLYISLIIVMAIVVLIRSSHGAAWAFAAFAPVLTVLVLLLMGLPRPTGIGSLPVDKARVVAAVMRPGVAIYVWTRTDGAPVALSLPWSEELAQGLQQGLRDAQAQGVDGVLLYRQGQGNNYGVMGIPPPVPLPSEPKPGEELQ